MPQMPTQAHQTADAIQPQRAATTSLPPRIVFATDWSNLHEVILPLQLTLRILGAPDAAEIVLTVPRQPGEMDQRAAQLLLEAAAGHADLAALPRAQVESFPETAAKPFAVVVAPAGEVTDLLIQLADLYTFTQRLTTAPPATTHLLNTGNPRFLKARLDSFCHIKDAPATTETEDTVRRLQPATRALYVAPGRLMVQTPDGDPLMVPSDNRGRTPNLVLHGAVDPSLSAYLAAQLRAGMVIVHAGANIGSDTVSMGRKIGPAGTIVAYETDPELLPFLQENVLLNRLDSTVRVRQEVLLDRPAHVRAASRREWYGPDPHRRSGFDLLPTRERDLDTDIVVPAVSLDSQLMGSSVVIDLLLLHRQGEEVRALLGAADLLTAGRIHRIVLCSLRENLGADWPVFLRLVTELEAAGWALGGLDDQSGVFRRVPAAAFAEVGGLTTTVLSGPSVTEGG